MIYQNLFIPIQGLRWLEPVPSAQGARWNPMMDRTSFQHGDSHANPHSLKLGQLRHSRLPHVHIVGMWEETKYREKTQATFREHAHSTQAVVLARKWFSYQHYNEMMLKEITLFEDRLYLSLAVIPKMNYWDDITV